MVCYFFNLRDTNNQLIDYLYKDAGTLMLDWNCILAPVQIEKGNFGILSTYILFSHSSAFK